MEYKLQKYIIVLYVLYGTCFSAKYTAFFSNNSLNWNDAKTYYRLVGDGINVPLTEIKVTIDPSNTYNLQTTFGWVDALAAYQPWMEYLGCYVVNPQKIQAEFTVSSSSQVFGCVNQCPGSYYIGLQQSKCVCLSNLTTTNPDVTGLCNSEFCNGDGNGLCAADSGLPSQYSVYIRGTRSVQRNVGDCLVLTINRNTSPSAYYEPAPCGTSICPLCYKNGVTTASSVKTTWNGAVTTCSSLASVMTSPYHISGTTTYLSDGSYWLAQIRKVQYSLSKDFVPGVENYCLAARVRSGDFLEYLIRPCDMQLPALSYVNDGITTVSTNKIRPTPPPPISDGMIALIVFLPGAMLVGIAAVIGWYTWRYYERKYKNNSHVTNQTSDVSYYESSSGCGTTDISHYDDDNAYTRKDLPNSALGQHCSTDGSHYDTCSENPTTTQDDTYMYNHIKHTGTQNDNNSGNGYDVMVSGTNGMIVNGYHIGNTVSKQTINYDTMASLTPRKNSDVYDSTDKTDENTTLLHYDTMASILNGDKATQQHEAENKYDSME